MGTVADRVGLPQPLGELVIEFGRGHDSEVMHEEALRVRTGTSDPRVLDATLEVEKAVE
jgi:molybdopterin biosynthesis enzyme